MTVLCEGNPLEAIGSPVQKAGNAKSGFMSRCLYDARIMSLINNTNTNNDIVNDICSSVKTETGLLWTPQFFYHSIW